VGAKKERRDNVTPDNIDALMLCQIPFVSTQTAEAILAAHKTVHGLVQALQADPGCLKGVAFQGSNRKISSKSVDSVVRYLLRPPTWGENGDSTLKGDST
jgi:hypothetical protein